MTKKRHLFPQSFSFDFEVMTKESWDSVDANQLRQALVSRLATLSDEQLLGACYREEEEPDNFSGWDRQLLERFHPDPEVE